MAKKIKKISILGSTGSIGVNALSIIENNPATFKVMGLSAGRNLELFASQVLKHKPECVSIRDSKNIEKFKKILKSKSKSKYAPAIYSGDTGAIKIAGLKDVDMVLSAIVGSAGLKPTWEAVKKGKRVAIANKESIVMAGRLLFREAKKTGAQILPVDSEHSAIFQSMLGHNRKEIKRLILTASGGPFLGRDRTYLKSVGLKETLKHPNWEMGAKITIDSATLMNKALEIIEARWLFDVSPEKISVMIHPQSIVHSIVEYRDGSMISQMGIPDMRVPISYALSYPERLSMRETHLELESLEKLTFIKPNDKMFPTLKYAYEALAKGDSMCIALNAANEASVHAFMYGKIQFLDIFKIIGRILREQKPANIDSIDDALELHRKCTVKTEKLIEKH